MIAHKYFDKFFSAETDELVLAFSIYSVFFIQIYYHLNNQVCYGKTLSLSFFYFIYFGSTSILAATIFYNILSWQYFGIVFCLSSIARFNDNISLYASGEIRALFGSMSLYG